MINKYNQAKDSLIDLLKAIEHSEKKAKAKMQQGWDWKLKFDRHTKNDGG